MSETKEIKTKKFEPHQASYGTKIINNFVPIHTNTGKEFNLFDIQPEDVCLEDLAHNLCMKPRWGSNSEVLVTVGFHTLMGYLIMNRMADVDGVSLDDIRENLKYMLLHDSAEAYFGDIMSPLKRLLFYEDDLNGRGLKYQNIQDLEDKICHVIFDKYNLPLLEKQPKHGEIFPDDVKQVDLWMGVFEALNFFTHPFDATKWREANGFKEFNLKYDIKALYHDSRFLLKDLKRCEEALLGILKQHFTD